MSNHMAEQEQEQSGMAEQIPGPQTEQPTGATEQPTAPAAQAEPGTAATVVLAADDQTQVARAGQLGRLAGRTQRTGRAPEGETAEVESTVVRIYRCAKVVKGGRTFSFGALVVAGDRRGNVGIGYGKANEVPQSVEKATKEARKNMFKVNLKGTTIPHMVTGRAGATKVVLIPARPGTGVTAGKSVRPCLELAGITDVLSKAYGSTSPKNLVKATIAALKQLQTREQVERARGVPMPAHAGEIL